ncbi:MAG: NAD(P)-dependent oxidoreductase [Gemmatimonadetes bacterium]|nr:NAD(P)-dependent oxidoreductase [Gemmatimonadota bacterium]MYG86882.1 NAD(P)-dependent oxidoreductase [Gemmatimonadota bacterium]MYJ89365.1 NAD(P)-dependent oxidoreductase [Gemmatimonadota bacterium]
MNETPRILVTGSAGAVGTIIVNGLRDRYPLRGFDRVPTPGLEDEVVADINDMDAVLQATEGMDAVIHLAGNPSGGASWEEILHANFIGTYTLFEAANRNGVRRVAFASRAGLLAPYPQDVYRRIDLPPRPESYYSISKVFGESLGYMYAVRFDMEVVCVRIGNFQKQRDLPGHPHHLSHGDAVRVFERAVIHPGIRFEVVFGVSDSTWDLYDLDHGRQAIDYYPQDKSVIDPEA